MELTKAQTEILTQEGHLLIEGGPGSGKTTIAIIKTSKIISEKLQNGQKALFLSFSRAAVSRVIEAIFESELMSPDKSKLVEVETYHSFFWQIIKTHGYLLGLPRQLSILTPPAQAVALAAIYNAHDEEKSNRLQRSISDALNKLAFQNGQISFDLFSPLVMALLSGSKKISRRINAAFPFILLDEFQDTNKGQWDIIKILGQGSTLIALADPEQRIYDFIGADPERLNHFQKEFAPKEFNLGGDNHRSNGTDIALFGNDILTGKFRQEKYKGVQILKYAPNPNQAYTALKVQTFQARKRLLASEKKEWSLAVLVPTKRLIRLVSDAFRERTEIYHTAAIEMEGVILAAEVIAYLLQPNHSIDSRGHFIDLISNFYRGKGGSAPTQTDLGEADSFSKAYERIIIAEQKDAKQPKTKLSETIATFTKIVAFKFSGNPYEDWLKVRSALEGSECKRLNMIGQEARNIRLLDRGTQLRDALSKNWRDNGSYSEALNIVRLAFVQEHFATTSRPETGVIVMNMHKAKGKQFDEVIIFEGWRKVVKGKVVANTDRVVRFNSSSSDLNPSRQNLRVSITRAKTMTTILTSNDDPCILLPN